MESFKKAYLYDEKTGVFLREYDAQLSPTEPEVKDESGNVVSEAVYIKPTHSTFKAPPGCRTNEVARFEPKLDAWGIIADFRGQTWYNKDTGEPSEIVDAGTPDSSLVAVMPPAIELRKAKESRIEALKLDCTLSIVGNFFSDATGTRLRYGFEVIDQHNIMMAATAAMTQTPDSVWSVLLPCQDASGNWSKVAHNAAQVGQVMREAVSYLGIISAKMEKLRGDVEKARAVADVQKVTW